MATDQFKLHVWQMTICMSWCFQKCLEETSLSRLWQSPKDFYFITLVAIQEDSGSQPLYVHVTLWWISWNNLLWYGCGNSLARFYGPAAEYLRGHCRSQMMQDHTIRDHELSLLGFSGRFILLRSVLAYVLCIQT